LARSRKTPNERSRSTCSTALAGEVHRHAGHAAEPVTVVVLRRQRRHAQQLGKAVVLVAAV